MSDRMLHFGGGEFWKPGVAETPWYEARKRFLEAVHKVEPQVAGDLAEHLLPLYQGQDEPETELPYKGRRMAKYLVENPSFPQWFLSWRRSYRIDTPWVRKTALHTLRAWSEGSFRDRWHFPPRPNPLDDEIDTKFPPFHHKGTPLTQKTLAEATRAIRETFERELEIYVERVTERYEEAGYLRTPRKSARTADYHFEWLARYQVLRQSCDKIRLEARERRSSSQMVEQAVKRLAEFIELPLRPKAHPDTEDRDCTFPPYRGRIGLPNNRVR